MIRLSSPGNNLGVSKNQEWLETNGLGAFASSTVTGLNARRYHGLLTAATRPPVGRMVLLSRMEETLTVDGERIDLSCNQFPGIIHPRGCDHLAEFRLDPFPVFTYQFPDFLLIKRVFMVHGENTTVIEYEIAARPSGVLPRKCCLEVRPLIAFRDYHSLTHRNDALNAGVRMIPGLATVAPYPDTPALHFAHNAECLRLTPDWYYNFEYQIEQERGLDFQEDLFNPFTLKFDLRNGEAAIIASLKPHEAAEAMHLRESEVVRRHSVSTRLGTADSFIEQLTAAADQFLVQRADFESVIAGYHWFTDWGRDTMIALPGLTLVTGRFSVARAIFRAFAAVVDQCMLPNRFTDESEKPEYNEVDATLWFFEAVASFLRYTNDYAFVKQYLFAALVNIFDWHVRGTRYGIRVNERGLLECGEAGAQLTWMDAKVGDFVVTPREGMPVEIQALWYNALCVLAELSVHFGETSLAVRANEMAALAKANFNRLFWNESAGCLYDVVNADQTDAAIRPNQILALSLSHPILEDARFAAVVKVVERCLLTPRGLRSLAAEDPHYRPHYEGDPWHRDTAYHQGTVWSWLLGPFVKAYLRAHGQSAEAHARAKEILYGVQDHFLEAGLGQISEIFDAEAPHRPRGCIAQAWSVAEILRAAIEDVNGVRAPFEQEKLVFAAA